MATYWAAIAQNYKLGAVLHLRVDVLQDEQTHLLLFFDIKGCLDLSYLDLARLSFHFEVSPFFASFFYADCMCDKLFPPNVSLAFQNGGCLR